jgi:adenosine deaminase
MRSSRYWDHVTALLLILAGLLAPARTGAVSPPFSEAGTQRYLESIRKDPNLVLAFLRDMPKGGDLHNHLSGAIYAETLIDWAAAQNDCVDSQTFHLAPPPCGPGKSVVPANNAFADPVLYRNLVDAFSMRNWQLSGESGHDHFFDSFDKFMAATVGNTGAMLAYN